MLDLTRPQILAFRRQAGGLGERLPAGPDSLRRAAWAGLQDSMPRAALLSIHARVAGTGPSTWEHPSLVQLWGPRFNVFVVAARDLAVFSLGTLPDDTKGRRRAEDLAARLNAVLGGARMSHGEAGRALGVHPNSLGTRPRPARSSSGGTARGSRPSGPCRRPEIEPPRRPPGARPPVPARLRSRPRPRRLPGGRGSAGGPASRRSRRSAPSLTPVQTPIGDAWILGPDEAAFRAAPGPAAPARLLPSGDAYFLLQGADRDLLVPDAAQPRRAVDPPRLARRPPRRWRDHRDLAPRGRCR